MTKFRGMTRKQLDEESARLEAALAKSTAKYVALNFDKANTDLLSKEAKAKLDDESLPLIGDTAELLVEFALNAKMDHSFTLLDVARQIRDAIDAVNMYMSYALETAKRRPITEIEAKTIASCMGNLSGMADCHVIDLQRRADMDLILKGVNAALQRDESLNSVMSKPTETDKSKLN